MIRMRVEGGEELAAALAALSIRLSKPIVKGALVEAGQPMAQYAESRVTRDSTPPHIADNVVVVPVRGEDQATVAVGPRRGLFWGLFLEAGTRKMAARPFLRPAFDAMVGRTIDLFAAAIWRELAGKGISRSVSLPTVVAHEGPIL